MSFRRLLLFISPADFSEREASLLTSCKEENARNMEMNVERWSHCRRAGWARRADAQERTLGRKGTLWTCSSGSQSFHWRQSITDWLMGRRLLCLAFRGMERFTATRGRPHIGQMKRMWHMAVVAVLQRTLDRNTQAGWICHGSSRLRLSPRLLRKITKWYGSATSRDRRFWTGPKGECKGWARIWHHCGLWWESESHLLEHIGFRGVQLMNVGGRRKLQEGNGVKNVSWDAGPKGVQHVWQQEGPWWR